MTAVAKHKKVSPKVPRTQKVASSPKVRGLAAIEINNPTTEVTKQLASVIPFVIKTGIVLGLGYLIVRKYTNRFQKLPLNPKFPPANITDSQAETRANAIASSLAFFDWGGDEFAITSQNLAGLNYNGFVKVYNAFGKQKGHLFAGDLTLIEWINDQFTPYEVSQLSLLLGGAFF